MNRQNGSKWLTLDESQRFACSVDGAVQKHPRLDRASDTSTPNVLHNTCLLLLIRDDMHN